MRLWLISLFFLSSITHAKAYVFVSFSMPEQLLIETLKESESLHLPVVLNGLYQNEMPKTLQRIMRLSNDAPNAGWMIDPTLFERFNIHQVPAVVVEKGHCFDVIYGNLRIHEALMRIREKGVCS